MAGASIIGWAHTPFGKLAAPSTEDLMRDVLGPALGHAGVTAAEVDGIFVGVMNHGYSKQDFQAALIGMMDADLHHTPAVCVENACATGSAALYAALDFIEAGRGRIALVIGAEKMTGHTSALTGDILLGASYRSEEDDAAGFAGLMGRLTRGYFDRYGDHSEEMAMIAVKNHANGVENPFAHLRRPLEFDFCNSVSERNPYVAAPLRRTDCSLISDGAAALVVANGDVAARMPRRIAFRSRVQVNDVLALSRRDPLEFTGVRLAWSRALLEAGLTLGDLDLVELHDGYTIAELIQYEAMGLAERGQGGRVIREGMTLKDGTLPTNPSGGLKAKGHPIGATGVSQHVLAAMQLTEESEGMQIPSAGLAGVFNMGGIGVANYVSILERTP